MIVLTLPVLPIVNTFIVQPEPTPDTVVVAVPVDVA